MPCCTFFDCILASFIILMLYFMLLYICSIFEGKGFLSWEGIIQLYNTIIHIYQRYKVINQSMRKVCPGDRYK